MALVTRWLLASLFGLHLFALPASAENFMFSYNTLLSSTDAFSSKGAPLEGWCTLLQQDRANFHRFKKRDPEDEPDPFFNTPERRAMMTGKCEPDPNTFRDPVPRYGAVTENFI